MSTSKLILAEIKCRPINFILSMLAVATAAAMFVSGPTIIAGYASDTKKELDVLKGEADQLLAEADGHKAEADELQKGADELQNEANDLQKEADQLQNEAVEIQKEADDLQTKIAGMQDETNRLLAEMDKQTKRIMRDLGVNLRIVHKDTNMGSLYTDFVAKEFDEEYVHRLAEAPSIETIVHVVAMLQHKMKWNDRTVLLVGTKPVLTESQKNEEKPHMVKPVEPGTVIVGSELAGDHKEGDKISVNDVELTIAKIMPEFGGLQDVQLLVDLKDAQKIADKEGLINQIMALNCKCKGDRLSVIRAELEGVLKDTKVTEFKSRAEAREKQRDLVEEKRQQQTALIETALEHVRKNQERVKANQERAKENHQRAITNHTHVKANQLRVKASFERAKASHERVAAKLDRQREGRDRQMSILNSLVFVTTPAIILASALFVGLMTWLNVRERRTEIGLLRALGKGSVYVIGLFMGKSALLGLLGGISGAAIGCAIALNVCAAMNIAEAYIQLDYLIIVATIVGAPIIAALGSYLPTLSAVSQDPAVVLMDA